MKIVQTPQVCRSESLASHAPDCRQATLAVALLAAAFAAPCTPAIASDNGVGPAAAQHDTRAMAPEFSLSDRRGAAVRLEDLRGDVVYIDFWASWCPPCLKSFPWMSDLAERHAADGLKVLAISLDADRAAAERFIEAVQPNFAVVFDPDASSAQAFDVLGMPSSFVIDREGRIAYTHVGFRRKDVPRIEQAVATVLAEASSTVLQADAGDAQR